MRCVLRLRDRLASWLFLDGPGGLAAQKDRAREPQARDHDDQGEGHVPAGRPRPRGVPLLEIADRAFPIPVHELHEQEQQHHYRVRDSAHAHP